MTFTKLFGAVALATVSAIPLALPARATLAQPADATPADFKTDADEILKAAFPADGPGAAVVVTRGGKVIYSGARGLAEVETRRPITTDTAFPLGSITKQFTASVVLQLTNEGKISLNDPLSRFFPDWPGPGAKATVRQLLNHTSGIQDFSKIPGWIAKNRTESHTTADLVALTRSLGSKAEPGHAWEYNNGGYVILGAIVENVTGKPWHRAVVERIAQPLVLKTIAPLPSQVTAATVRGYREENGRTQPVQASHPSVPHAAGGLVGSITDIARWAHALHHGRIVSSPGYQDMISPARLADGSTEPYGFGLRLRKIRGRPALVHGGAGAGLDTDSVYIPSEDLFVAVFANSGDPATDPSLLTRRLAALALGEPIPTFTRAEVELRTIEPLFGAYRTDGGAPRVFFRRDGKLYMSRGVNEKEAFAAGGDRFYFGPDDLDWFRIMRKGDGAHVLEMHGPELAAPVRAVRSGPVPPPFTVAPAVLQSYVGTYNTEALAVSIELGENGRLTITPERQRAMEMRPVSETEFRIDGTPMRVVFHPEKNGKVERLTIYRGARELHGTRIRG